MSFLNDTKMLREIYGLKDRFRAEVAGFNVSRHPLRMAKIMGLDKLELRGKKCLLVGEGLAKRLALYVNNKEGDAYSLDPVYAVHPGKKVGESIAGTIETDNVKENTFDYVFSFAGMGLKYFNRDESIDLLVGALRKLKDGGTLIFFPFTENLQHQKWVEKYLKENGFDVKINKLGPELGHLARVTEAEYQMSVIQDASLLGEQHNAKMAFLNLKEIYEGNPTEFENNCVLKIKKNNGANLKRLRQNLRSCPW